MNHKKPKMTVPQFCEIPFYRGFSENHKGPGTSFQAPFFRIFLIKNCVLQYYINWPIQ